MSFSQLANLDVPLAPTGKKEIKSRKTSQTDEIGGGAAQGQAAPERGRKTAEGGPDIDMLIAQVGADQSEDSTMATFLDLLDLKDFARVFAKEKITLDQLRKFSAQQLQDLGIPSGARKKLLSALHP